jgi:hypothetical protein
MQEFVVGFIDYRRSEKRSCKMVVSPPVSGTEKCFFYNGKSRAAPRPPRPDILLKRKFITIENAKYCANKKGFLSVNPSQ